MNYLLFNNEILISDGANVRHIEKKDDYKDILGSIEEAFICVVDVDVLIAAAVESPVEKKDSILVRKFKELYGHEAYIIQDEKIDDNLFQVMGIKEQWVREIYSLIPPQKVETFVPYGIALRNTLINKKVDLNKTVVFVDDQGGERLLTVFDGLKFSRTRLIANNGEDLLSEIRRSQIDFFKKNEEYLNRKNTDFTIIVNNQSLADEITRNADGLSVEHIDIAYPALEGLKAIDTQIKYRLPEDILRNRQEIEWQKNVTTMFVCACVLAAGLFYWLFNNIESDFLKDQYDFARQLNEQLNKSLSLIDRATYREDLKRQKYLNYGISYLAVLDLLPVTYQVTSFRFFKSDHWHMDLSLSADESNLFDPIPKVGFLKNADIKDVFVNNQPGKRLRLTL